MSEFKIPPYLYWYPSDWLNDPEVRRLPPEVKGFYIDLICQLHFAFPYGYCSLINHKKTSKLQNQVNQKSNQDVNLRVELLLSIPVADQLKLCENMEHDLSKYIPYTTEQITSYIKVLEERMILSRSANGIIYSRRMVKDFKKRVTAYLNGSKGGNPGIKKRKYVKKTGENLTNKILSGKKLRNQVNQKSNQVGYANTDLQYNKEFKGREGAPAAGNSVFKLQKIYDSTFEELSSIGYSKKLTEPGFLKWKQFVDFVVANDYQELFVAQFVKPQDFEELWRGGFVHNPKDPAKDLWKLVCEKMLATGMKPEQNLYYRIPQFSKLIKKDTKEEFKISDDENDYSLKI